MQSSVSLASAIALFIVVLCGILLFLYLVRKFRNSLNEFAAWPMIFAITLVVMMVLGAFLRFIFRIH